MLTKRDCVLLLSELSHNGIDTSEMMDKLFSRKEIDLDVLKFINSHRELDLTAFYQRLRKNYNNKKSDLYINIVKVDEEEPKDVLTTLGALNLQILLYSNKVQDKQMFLKHARAKEINMVLVKYLTDYDIASCIKLLKLIKADLQSIAI